ncbi:zinc metalloprotease HtpX [Fusobacterium sp.]|uniref:zinc metalloprotease HtpX n=1 Tax=Fusobacterium sp. TaxID=68766 RepID=UPI0026382DEF|nr:zinc metalloprotease HtpX [Fusobacterium sp.]
MKNFKTFILMGVMTFLMLFIGNLIGGRQGVYFAFIFAGITNFISYWYSDKIVLSMYGARAVSENTNLYKLVERLVRKADLPMPKVYIIDSPQPNAFATGRNPKHAAVAVTTGILEILDDNELSGVIGHELGHVNNMDILIGTVAATFAGAISFLASIAKWGAIFGSSRNDEDRNPLALILVSIFAPIAAMLVQMAISRTREYKADEFGAKLSGDPLYLANALKKLELGVRRNPMNANPATENMFIVSPLAGDKMANLFSTHPSTQDRIERLYEMARK